MSYIPAKLREITRANANKRCEYCLLNEAYSERSYEVDHIIPEKHLGQTIAENLRLSYANCNRFKGSNVRNKVVNCKQLFLFR